MNRRLPLGNCLKVWKLFCKWRNAGSVQEALCNIIQDIRDAAGVSACMCVCVCVCVCVCLLWNEMDV